MSPGRRRIRVGSRTFTFVLAMGMAVTALGIDGLLPAFPDIRAAMGLDADATEVAGLVTFFLIGSSAGLLPAGVLADRYGRRAVMLGGLVLYVAGALAAVLAPTLPVMFAARFVWGLGSAGPRVAAMAMIRDAYDGDEMAKQMSFMMAVFILVPTFAPAVSSGLLRLGPWQIVFWLCAVAGAALLVVSFRLPETLEPSDRLALSAGDVWRSCRTVLLTPGTYGYLVALTALFGVFLSYIASSEIILDEVFGLSDWFALFFGAMSLVMGAGMYLNGHVVEGVGLDRLTGRVLIANLVAVGAAVGGRAGDRRHAAVLALRDRAGAGAVHGADAAAEPDVGVDETARPRGGNGCRNCRHGAGRARSRARGLHRPPVQRLDQAAGDRLRGRQRGRLRRLALGDLVHVALSQPRTGD